MMKKIHSSFESGVMELKFKLETLKKLSLKKKLILASGTLLAVFITVGIIAYAMGSDNSGESDDHADSRTEVSDTSGEKTAEEKPAQASEPAAYTLEPYQGDVYAIKKPKNWNVTDNLNAIETTDPKDPLTGVTGSIIMGAFGEQTPEGHIQFILDSIGASSIKYEHTSREEQVKERWTGLNWVVKTQTFTFTDAGGNRVKAKATAGVLQGSGQYVALVSAFQTTPAKWNRWAPTLERIMQTIQITDGSRVGGHDKVRLPSASDLKSDSSPLMDSWEYRNRSGDRTSQDYSDAIMGQESGLTSPSTGTSYTLPLSNYDPTVGGYRNPNNPSEILQDSY